MCHVSLDSLHWNQLNASMSIKLHSSFAVHPGEWLRREIVDPAGLSVTEAAGRLHVTDRR